MQQALNRGYNLMVTAFLFLAGLAFASGAIAEENELTDRLDDLGLLAAGIILLVWYLIGTNRLKLSFIPPLMALLALAVQIFGLFNERADSAAVGDNIGGMVLFVPFVLFSLYQYWRLRQTALQEVTPTSISAANR